MAKSHYETLGLRSDASAADIRSAYRRLVLKHHPDRSSAPESKEIFLQVSAAYEVLSDPQAKQRYDEYQASIARAAQQEAKYRADQRRKQEEAERLQTERQATQTGSTIAEEIKRLQVLYGSGRHLEAENLAHNIIQISHRQAIPYAVLADIYRGRGEVNEASKMYAYAAQMDPNNPVYQRRYEALLNQSQIVSDRRGTRMKSEDSKVLAPMVGGTVVLFNAIAVALSSSSNAFLKLPFISTWSFGLMVSLFLSGLSVGAGLAVGNWLDRFTAVTETSSGSAGPTIVLGIVAMVNFWVAALMYILIALGLRAFNFSTTRLMLGVSAAVLLLAIACIPSQINPIQTLLWGGNVVYVGGLVGWMATDSMRP